MPKMNDDETTAFLEEPGHLLRLGTTDADGTPRVAPIWFIYREGQVWFTPRAASVFLHNIRRDPRVGLSIDEEPLPYRKLTVQGVAKIVHETGEDDAWRDLYRAIACRYVPEEAAEAYIQNTIDQPRALCALALATSKVSTWRMPVGEEAGTGIWARRYYVPGSIMDERAKRGE